MAYQQANAQSKQSGAVAFKLDTQGRKASLITNGGGKTSLLSWAVGRDVPGVRYMNFGLIGATVNITKRMETDIIASEIEAYKPDIIVFGYGTNEGFDDNLNIDRYIGYLRKLQVKLAHKAPDAQWVFLGAMEGQTRRSKRSTIKCGGGWRVPLKLPKLRTAIKIFATDINAAYWDLSASMGGNCGGRSWVTRKLMAKDRVHLTQRGYKTLAADLVSWMTSPVEHDKEKIVMHFE